MTDFSSLAPWPLGPSAPASLAALALTTPVMLFGAALIALPIIAHLLNRKARRRIVFPSVALLAAVSASQSSLFKLRRWLLLVLRCAAVLLVVLTFTRPAWLNPGNAQATTASTSGGTGGAAVVIVLDRSVSTRQVIDGRRVADQLRDRVMRELANLRAGTDHANVVFADAAPAAVFDRMTRNLDALRAAVRAGEPTEHRADFAGAIHLAGQLLADHPDADAARHLLVFTDGQASNWDDLPPSLNLPADVTLTLRALGEDDKPIANTALLDPAARPATPGVNVPVELSVQVAAFGPSAGAVRSRVDLLINGREVETQWVQAAPHRPRRVSFTHRFEAAGTHRVQFRLDQDDALDLDHDAALVVSAVQRRPVVIVGDENPDQPGTAGYYLTRALAPRNNERDRYLVTHLAAAAVNGRALRGAALVCVGDVNTQDPRTHDALRRYVAQGGSLLVFAGERPLRSEALLPWTLGGPLAPARLTDGDWGAAELRGFDTEAQDALARTTIRRPWQTFAPLPEARLLLSYDNRQPALAARPIGGGRVVAATFSPATHSGEFGKYAAFVVLMQSLAEQLTADGPAPPPTRPGHPLRITAHDAPNPQGPASIVQTPADTPAPNVAFALDHDTAVATVPAADRAGFYTWKQGPASLGVAAVTLDPRESDLRRTPAEALATALTQRHAATVAAGTGGDEAALDLRGRPLWGWMLLGALGLMCVEMGVLGGWRR